MIWCDLYEGALLHLLTLVVLLCQISTSQCMLLCTHSKDLWAGEGEGLDLFPLYQQMQYGRLPDTLVLPRSTSGSWITTLMAGWRQTTRVSMPSLGYRHTWGTRSIQGKLVLTTGICVHMAIVISEFIALFTESMFSILLCEILFTIHVSKVLFV